MRQISAENVQIIFQQNCKVLDLLLGLAPANLKGEIHETYARTGSALADGARRAEAPCKRAKREIGEPR